MCLKKKKPGTLLQASAIRQDACSYSSTLIGRLISIFLSSVKQRIIIIHKTTLYRCPLHQPGPPSPIPFRLSFPIGGAEGYGGPPSRCHTRRGVPVWSRQQIVTRSFGGKSICIPTRHMRNKVPWGDSKGLRNLLRECRHGHTKIKRKMSHPSRFETIRCPSTPFSLTLQ